jgi:hypothetical protein
LSEFGKSLPAEKVREINVILSDAEDQLNTNDLETLKEKLFRVESVAAELTSLLITISS